MYYINVKSNFLFINTEKDSPSTSVEVQKRVSTLSENGNDSPVVESYTNTSGNTGILVNSYRFRRGSETSQKIVWRCMNKDCKVRFSTTKQLAYLSQLHDHNHPPPNPLPPKAEQTIKKVSNNSADTVAKNESNEKLNRKRKLSSQMDSPQKSPQKKKMKNSEVMTDISKENQFQNASLTPNRDKSLNLEDCPLCQKKFSPKCHKRLHLSEHLFFDSKSRKIMRETSNNSEGEKVSDSINLDKSDKNSTQVKELVAEPYETTFFIPSDFKYTCTHCDKMFVYKIQLTCHQMSQHGEASTKTTSKSAKAKMTNENSQICEICGAFIESLAAMKKHKNTHDSNNTSEFQCKTCNITVFSLISFRKHMKLHEKGPFLCDICGEIKNSSKVLNIHKKKHLSESLKYKCKICLASFHNHVALCWHENQKHSLREFKCLVCNAKFENSVEFRKHKKDKHSILRQIKDKVLNNYKCEKAFGCGVCGKRFKRCQDKITHENKIHILNKDSKVIKHLCNYCPKTLTTFFLKRQHERKHAFKTLYPCSSCKKIYLYSKSYRDHMEIKHYDKLLSSFSQRQKLVKKRASLKLQNQTKTEEKNKQKSNIGKEPKKRGRPRKSTSTVTQKKSPTKKTVAAFGQPIVDKVKVEAIFPFSCSVCNTRFKDAEDRDEHQLEHAAKPPKITIKRELPKNIIPRPKMPPVKVKQELKETQKQGKIQNVAKNYNANKPTPTFSKFPVSTFSQDKQARKPPIIISSGLGLGKPEIKTQASVPVRNVKKEEDLLESCKLLSSQSKPKNSAQSKPQIYISTQSTQSKPQIISAQSFIKKEESSSPGSVLSSVQSKSLTSSKNTVPTVFPRHKISEQKTISSPVVPKPEPVIDIISSNVAGNYKPSTSTTSLLKSNDKLSSLLSGRSLLSKPSTQEKVSVSFTPKYNFTTSISKNSASTTSSISQQMPALDMQMSSVLPKSSLNSDISNHLSLTETSGPDTVAPIHHRFTTVSSTPSFMPDTSVPDTVTPKQNMFTTVSSTPSFMPQHESYSHLVTASSDLNPEPAAPMFTSIVYQDESQGTSSSSVVFNSEDGSATTLELPKQIELQTDAAGTSQIVTEGWPEGYVVEIMQDQNQAVDTAGVEYSLINVQDSDLNVEGQESIYIDAATGLAIDPKDLKYYVIG